MWEIIYNFIYALSIILGILSILMTFINIVKYFVRKNKRNKLADEEKFYKVIESDDMQLLGDYLENVLGKITISEFANVKNINKNITVFLEKIYKFTSIEKDSEEETKLDYDDRKVNEDIYKNQEFENIIKNQIEHEKLESTDELLKYENVKDEFEGIKKELEYGEVWNALAKLRRMIELNVKKYAENRSIHVSHKISLGGLIYFLGKQDENNSKYFKILKNVVSVCNRAIHGEDVSYSEAFDVLKQFEYAIRLFKN